MLIDCDPGIDHVASIYYAAQHFDLVQITTTHGNAALEVTTTNALRLLAFARLDVPVAAGCESALVETRHSAELFHGGDGLAGALLPEPVNVVQTRHAVEAIIETTRQHREELIVACLGPLTNLAIALRIEPRLCRWIREITLMGGSHGFGHMTPTTEFNFWCDPEAANIVCSSGAKVRIVGYELTRTLGLSAEHIAKLSSSGRKIAQLVGQVFDFNLERQRAIWGLSHSPIHSTLAIVPLVRPDLVRTCRRSMRVELCGNYTRGMSVYDDRPLDTLAAPPFEKLPPSEINCTVWVDPAAVEHVVETILTFN
jgi:inosine-uridine nucleoside N-ribohydrolase